MTKTNTPLVKFNFEEEFIDELRDHPPNMEPVLRVTRLYTDSATLPLKHVSVVATYLRDVAGVIQLVRLDRHVGQLLGQHDANGVQDKANALIEQITQAAKAKGLEVRAGIYE
jgi:hypothetical protein